MTYEKRTYPAQQGLEGATPKQASCPPTEFHTHSSHGELKSALDQLGQQDATPLQAAHNALDCAIDELSHQIHQLEDRLRDVLEPDEDEKGSFPQPPPAVPRCCNAIRRVQQQEDRINVLHRNIVDLLNRLEC